MKKLYALLAMVMMAIAPAWAEVVQFNYDENARSEHGSRYPSSIMVESADFGQQTINWASGTKHLLYTDATDKVITVTAGEEVQLLVNYTGTWMSAYVYIDLNADGMFYCDVDEENHCAKEGSELVSWSFYSFDCENSEDPGWNSKGEQLTGGARSTVNCPTFKVPDVATTYRARVKIDWNSIDPAGSKAGHLGGSMQANGGAIMDFTLNVEKAFEPVTIQFNQASGEWTSSNANKTWAAAWKSNATDPYLTVSCPNNNMAYDSNGDPKLYTGTVTKRETVWTIATQEGYEITDYQFNTAMLDGQWTSITPEGGEEVVTPTTGTALVEKHDINKMATTFTLKTQADNKGVQLSNFLVTITKSSTKQTSKVIFVYDKTAEHNVTYRIPSIASISAGEHAGRIVAFTDYRPGGADVGIGEVDIHAKYSDDFGETWSEEIKVVDGTWGSAKGGRWYSFGDPVSIADRETGKLLMVSCSGDIRFQSATRDHHQGMEVFWSEDGGATWTEPVDVSEQVYSVLPATPSLFVGSGGFVQSKYVKKGDYYRVYGGILTRNDLRNYIVYTDDFGKTWEVLGGADAYSLTGGDEAKAEELPDGSVLQSSRTTGGRIFNIWRWDDADYTIGHWEKQVTSNASNNGIVANSNACNGEIKILPAKRVADDKCVYLALQSIPFGGGRTNVGIYWKELESKDDYKTVATFAANWTKGLQVSYKSSAYSAMVLQEDGNIGMLIEEGTYGFDYSQIYHNLTYEQITDGLYTFKSDTDEDFDRSGFENEQRGSVTYNLLWNGELMETVTAYGFYGEELPAPKLPYFTEAMNMPALTMNETTDGKTYDIEVMWSYDAPVQLSNEYRQYYYYLKLKNKNWVVDTESGITLSGNYTAGDANAMWRIEGNPFKELWITSGAGRTLFSDDPRNDGNTGGNTHPFTVGDGEEVSGSSYCWWKLVPSTYAEGGFFIYSTEFECALNDRDSKLAFWTGGADLGSTFTVVEVPEDELPKEEAKLLFSVVGNVCQYPEDFGYDNTFPVVRDVKVDVYDSYAYIHAWAGVEGYDLKVIYAQEEHDTQFGLITESVLVKVVPVVNGVEQEPEVIQETEEDLAYVVPTGRDVFSSATISNLFFDIIVDEQDGYIDLYVEETEGYYLAWGVWDAINGVKANAEGKSAYNLNGQKVNRLHKGIYIINGKKVIIGF